jgi:putative ATPase
MSDLFEFSKPGKPLEKQREKITPSGPLAHRMRPERFEEFFGHERILGPGQPLRRWIERDEVPSLIFWGPPGCGKTTLAQLVAQYTSARFESLSAVHAGVKELKEITLQAREARQFEGRRTILFLDEIHRFNQSQQDALLLQVEEGVLTLIGATTENPSYEINPALLSRARVIRLEAIRWEALVQALSQALVDPVRGLGGLFQLDAEALEWLARISQGDVRKALSSLEVVALEVRGVGLQGQSLGLAQVRAVLEASGGRQPIAYDKKGDHHYQVISALIKSMRASDLDSGLYYLARMLEGGDDPLFIARRLVIFASEDVGNADPQALLIAIAAQQAVQFVGMPEARISLAQAVVYLARAPKSRACYQGIEAALAEVRRTGALPVPLHLRNSNG